MFRAQPVPLAIALLASGFGLRHAVYADQIAAIDNATRKLMQHGKQPVAVGLFFAMEGSFDRFRAVGNVTATGVSALFLFAIATANLIILRGA